MHRYPLAEIRERTCKSVDAWWTVLLVDPLAVPLVRLVAPYRWITPNRLTALATVFGLAAAACFAGQGREWLIAGALLFHLGFVVDCMDGKIARLNGTGTLFGAWFDFMFDRLRAIICAAALMGGQYARTGEVVYLWLAVFVVALDLFRYLNAGQMARIRATMQEERGTAPAWEAPAQRTPRGRLKDGLRRRRIRVHLVSGIEFEMFVFIVAPLTGWIVGTVVLTGALLVVFELRLILMFWRATRQHAAWRAGQATHSELLTGTSAPHSNGPEPSVVRQGVG
jgi:phosphatidylglycerophosphate synthase